MALADSRGSLTLAVSRPAALIREGSEAVERRLRALEAKRPLELEVVTRPSDASAGPRCWPPASETRCATPDVWRPTSLDSASSRSFREPRATTTTASWRSGCRTSSATPTPRPSCSPISWAMADSPKRCSAHAARRVRPPRQSPELRPPAQPSPRPGSDRSSDPWSCTPTPQSAQAERPTRLRRPCPGRARTGSPQSGDRSRHPPDRRRATRLNRPTTTALRRHRHAPLSRPSVRTHLRSRAERPGPCHQHPPPRQYTRHVRPNLDRSPVLSTTS